MGRWAQKAMSYRSPNNNYLFGVEVTPGGDSGVRCPRACNWYREHSSAGTTILLPLTWSTEATRHATLPVYILCPGKTREHQKHTHIDCTVEYDGLLHRWVQRWAKSPIQTHTHTHTHTTAGLSGSPLFFFQHFFRNSTSMGNWYKFLCPFWHPTNVVVVLKKA